MPLLAALHLGSAVASERETRVHQHKGTLMLMRVIILSRFMLAYHTRLIKHASKDTVQCYYVDDDDSSVAGAQHCI